MCVRGWNKIQPFFLIHFFFRKPIASEAHGQTEIRPPRVEAISVIALTEDTCHLRHIPPKMRRYGLGTISLSPLAHAPPLPRARAVYCPRIPPAPVAALYALSDQHLTCRRLIRPVRQCSGTALWRRPAYIPSRRPLSHARRIPALRCLHPVQEARHSVRALARAIASTMVKQRTRLFMAPTLLPLTPTWRPRSSSRCLDLKGPRLVETEGRAFLVNCF